MPKQISKVYLDGSILYPETLITKEILPKVSLTWTVNDYRQLKKNVLYCKTACEANGEWTMRLVRADDTAYVSLLSNHVNKLVYFSVSNCDGSVTENNEVSKEVEDGHYVTEFKDSTITHRKSKLLTKGVLLVKCSYDLNPAECISKSLTYSNLRFPADVQELSSDIIKLYETSKYSDFVINVDDEKFKVHKAVLCARSYFFRTLLLEDSFIREVFTSNTTPEVMHQVLMFIYTGELTKDIELRSLMEMVFVARRIEIPSLFNRCLMQIKSLISPDNVYAIAEFAKDSTSEYLKNAVNHFLEVQHVLLPEELLSQIKEILSFQGLDVSEKI